MQNHGEIAGYAINSDARDFCPALVRQKQCMEMALARAGLTAEQITIVNTHTTGTKQGDIEECNAVRDTFMTAPTPGSTTPNRALVMPWAPPACWNWLGNLPSFTDHQVHPTINLDNLDPECALPGLVANITAASSRCYPQQLLWNAGD